MYRNSNIELIKKLSSADKIEHAEWIRLLPALNSGEREVLRQSAADVATENFGRGVYVRGLIEISSYCRNNCHYCGLRCSNAAAERYRLTKEQVLECCEYGAQLGFNTFVLQGGEDPKQNDAWIADVTAAIREKFPDKAITLSVGERSANFDAVIPNSALRTDTNGTFVLVLTVKHSPLGNRYIATRVDVNVLAQDDTTAAVSGLSMGDYVITTSSKPLEAGMQVNMVEN